MRKVLVWLGIVGIVGSLGVYYYKQYETFKKFKVDLAGMKLVDFSFENTTVAVRLKVTNYSSVEAAVSNLHVDLYVNDQFVGTAYQDSSTLLIPSLGYNFIAANITIINGPIVQQLMTISNAGDNAKIAVRTKGSLSVASGVLNVSVKFDETYNTTPFELLKGM